MRQVSLWLTIGSLVLAGLPGCSDGPGEVQDGNGTQTPSLTGTWFGSTLTPPPQNGDRTLTLTLEETAGGVRGTYAFAVPGEAPYYADTLVGTHVHPDVALDLFNHEGGVTTTLEGAFTDGSTVVGTLNASWQGAAITLRRQ